MTETNNGWSKGACIRSLRRVAKEIGESPTKTQYIEHREEWEPSDVAIERNFETWNQAKEAAGLDTFSAGQFPNYKFVGKNQHGQGNGL